MPQRTDIQSIIILGAGPIVIGQACEFDYSGTQACQTLKKLGYRIILVNSNPATIMTDPEWADATYIEAIEPDRVEKIIAQENPDAILPTMGGQTALNCALALYHRGTLKKYGVEMIGAEHTSIEMAEDRDQFHQAMASIGLQTPQAAVAHNLTEAYQALEKIGFPAIIRPSFTLGGHGGGIAYNREEFKKICLEALNLSGNTSLMIDESILGWKEYELEVIRDQNDNCIIVCSIENVDPVGIHTGDSITVAPQMTLSDKEYQHMRTAAIAVLRKIGVATGGANVQFAVCPRTGRQMVIEMNPRVSRSSALASKVTGFPIAEVAAQLAVGMTLDELTNPMTAHRTPIAFEPALDYVAVKIPRFNFEKFPNSDAQLTIQMKSVGEVMGLGRTFSEALLKAICSLEIDRYGLESVIDLEHPQAATQLEQHLTQPGWERLWMIADAMRFGWPVSTIQQLTQIDPWFLEAIQTILSIEERLQTQTLKTLPEDQLLLIKQQGLSDQRISTLLNCTCTEIRAKRIKAGITPVYKRVDSCAAEFPTPTAYLYSSYEKTCEADPTAATSVMVLGSGPNRIGQGIEFDYCCVHAVQALRETGYETIMVNCNPETVSTDMQCSDRLYFEPLTLEHVLNIAELEKPMGLIIHYGGQTPLKLASDLEAAGIPILGTQPKAIKITEDREQFSKLAQKLKLTQPDNGAATSAKAAHEIADQLGYPLMIRPSFVLGGRAMEVLHHPQDLTQTLEQFEKWPQAYPLLIDRFLDNALEIDVDAVYDGSDLLIGGIQTHIEQAGVHSGDSACILPAQSLPPHIEQQLIKQLKDIAQAINIVGLLNAQFALQGNQLYILEVNPRASRTVPFIAKATGRPLAKIGARVKVGHTLAEQNVLNPIKQKFYAVKQPVFPFKRFNHVDPILGPEMRSTGEVMALALHPEAAFAKAWLASGHALPKPGQALISVRDADKVAVIEIARDLIKLNFTLIATQGTAAALNQAGLKCQTVHKVTQGRPHIVDIIINGDTQFCINTTSGKQAISDSTMIRHSALSHHIPYSTTLTGAHALVRAMLYQHSNSIEPLQTILNLNT